MQRYETSATVQGTGQVLVAGIPFAPETDVEVIISPKRLPFQEFNAAWKQMSSELRQRPGMKDLTDQDILNEIDCCRPGQ